MNFTNATIEINDCIDKKEAVIKKAGNILSEAIIDRIKQGSVNENLTKDIARTIDCDGFSDEEQKKILIHAIYNLAKSTNSGKKTKSNSNDDYFDDIFASRRR